MATNDPASIDKPVVLFVPGGVTPGDISYGPLLRVLGDQIHPIIKELEVYAADTPPAGYALDTEVEGIRRAADAAEAKRFHLVGYSGGGAFSLAFTAKYPERLNSLALIEPAWPGDHVPEDAADEAELARLMTLPPAEQMSAFIRWHFRPGIQPPPNPTPPGPPPPWMAKRPAGLQAISRVFSSSHIDQERFRLMDRPVYFALGSLSTRYFDRAAHRLAMFFPNFKIEEYEGRSHFDPPHRAEPERFARALHDLWARAAAAVTAEKMKG